MVVSLVLSLLRIVRFQSCRLRIMDFWISIVCVEVGSLSPPFASLRGVQTSLLAVVQLKPYVVSGHGWLQERQNHLILLFWKAVKKILDVWTSAQKIQFFGHRMADSCLVFCRVHFLNVSRPFLTAIETWLVTPLEMGLQLLSAAQMTDFCPLEGPVVLTNALEDPHPSYHLSWLHRS